MGWRISILAVWSLILSAGSAAALPGDDYLANWGQGGLGIIQDGTSNTIQFGETSQFDICFDNVGVPSNSGVFVVPGAAGPRVPIGTITDGSSNTIFFGESLCLNDVVIGDPPPGGIEDGTSNTIIIGEGSRFDICFSNVTQQITDGTSNTILLGESVCFEDLRVAAVPEPHAAALAFAALLAAVPYGRRKSIRRAAAAFRR
jgi:hypothetical protein